jgi:hypothetical protein
MKYLEEIKAGDTFAYQNYFYVLSSDYRVTKDKQTSYMCLDLNDGLVRWFLGSIMIEPTQLYQLDTNNNFSPLKQQ